MSQEYKVSKRFLLDHIERDLLSEDAIISIKGNYAIVNLTDDQWSELLSDAEYYSFQSSDFEDRGLCMSAKAVVRQLLAQE